MSDEMQRKEDAQTYKYEQEQEEKANHEWLEMIGHIDRTDPAYQPSK